MVLLVSFLLLGCTPKALNHFNEEILEKNNESLFKYPIYSVIYSCSLMYPKYVTYQVSNGKLSQINKSNRKLINGCLMHYNKLDYDYAETGFQKGHLIPSRYLKKELEYNLDFDFLISPQTKKLNESTWDKLENKVEKLSQDSNVNNVSVICGGISDKNPKFLNYIFVIPSFYYKVILVEYRENVIPKHETIAYIIPNNSDLKCICNYIKSIKEVEEFTGYCFFQNLNISNLEALKKNISNHLNPTCDEDCTKTISTQSK